MQPFSGNTPTHAVVFAGRLLPGHALAHVRPAAEAALKLSATQAARLFSGEPVTIKRGLSWPEALRYQAAFQKLGMILTLHTEAAPPAAGDAPAPTAAPAPRRDPAAEAAPAPEPAAPAATANAKPRPLRVQAEAMDAGTQLRLNLIAGLTLALPLLYLGGIYLLAAGLVHVLTADELFDSLAVALPALALSLLLFLWLEPLAPRRARGGETLALDSEIHAPLQAWCARLCDALDVPVPARLSLSLEARSRVQLVNGLASLWQPRLSLDLSGLQLAGLNRRQLDCLVGQELARYAQWRVMKLAFLIEAVHRWLAASLARPSRLSEWLSPGVAAADRRRHSRLAAGLLRTVEALRLPLLGLLKLSERTSRPVMHALCLRADRAAAQLYGPADMADALVAEAWLVEADELAEAKNWQAWEQGQLADDRVLLALRYARQASQDGQEAFRKELLATEGSAWDYDASYRERLDALARLGEVAAVFSAETELPLGNLPALNRELTERHYLALGIHAHEGVRIGSAQLLNLTQEQEEADAALERYFLGHHREDRFLPLSALEALGSTEPRFKQQLLQDSVDRLRNRLPLIERQYQQWDAIQLQLQQLHAARTRIDAGEHAGEEDLARIERALGETAGTLQSRLLDLQSTEELLSQRLAWALSLSEHLPPSVGPLFQTLRQLHGLQGGLDELRLLEGKLSALLELPGKRAHPRLNRALALQAEKLETGLLKLRDALYALPNPHGGGSLGSAMSWSELASGGDNRALLHFSRALRTQLGYYNRRFIGQLCRLAEPAEERHCQRPLRTRLAQIRA